MISGVLTLDGGGTHEFSYTAKAPAGAAPPVAAHLTNDADDILDAGQSARAAVGYTLPEDDARSAAEPGARSWGFGRGRRRSTRAK